MIPALILTAGHATRLRPLSLVRAKAVLPVDGVPLVSRILEWLRGSGVTDAVLNLQHLPYTITGVLGDGSPLGVRVRYSWEVPVLGSAGGPRRALPLLFDDPSRRDSTFLIVNGDTLTTADIRPALEQHRSTGALVTMMVVPNQEPDKYGGVLADADGTVRGFSRRGSGEPSYHFFGAQIVEARAFSRVPANVPYESVSGLYPELIAERPGSVRAFTCGAEYLDIGTPADYLRTSLRMASREGRVQLIGARARIHQTARLDEAILWDDVEIGRDVTLQKVIVTDGVTVPAGSTWHGVTIRRFNGELVPGERREGDLAVMNL
jgi:NDP-sugar pyrophosphorylase family protein